MSLDCNYNGKSSRPQQFRFTDETTDGMGQQIDLNELATCKMRMQQITVHWQAIPTTSEDLVLWKDSVEGSKYDTVLRRVDPQAENIQNLVCVIPFYFAKGDRIRVDYANTDDQDIGVEIMAEQVFE